MKEDNIIKEVRNNREKLLSKYDNDLDKLVAEIKDRNRIQTVKSKTKKRPKD